MTAQATRWAVRPVPAERLARYASHGLTTEQAIPTVLARTAASYPHRPAVLDVTGDAETRLDYARLWSEATALAAWLHGAGVGPGTPVIIQAPNHHRTLVAFWAVWHLGGICVPVVDIYRSRELRDILRQVPPVAVITVHEHRGHHYPEMFDQLLGEAGLRPARLLLTGAADGWAEYGRAVPASGGQASPPDAGLCADDPVLILFTSGTTARPKGVLHSSRTLLADSWQLITSYGLSWRDRGYLALPTAHITGVLFSLTMPVLAGASVVLSRPRGLDRTAEEMVGHGVSWAAGPARLLGLLAEHGAASGRPSPLKAFSCGGIATSPDLIQVAKDAGLPAFRTYGMTECPTITSTTQADSDYCRFHTDGRIAFGVECEAVDPDTRTPLPPGEVGELRVRGPERMLGYLDEASSAAGIDDDGWFYTGDLGLVDDQGCVLITGRIKDIINRGGEKFSARDIETALLDHPDVADVAVIPMPDTRLGEVPAAFLVPAQPTARTADRVRDPAPVAPEQLAAFLAAHGVAPQKTPVRWEWLTELPRTPTGKVRKGELARRVTGEVS